MLSEYIKVGDRVEISLKRENAIDKSYISLVEDKINDSDLILDVPISYGQLVVLKPGDGYWFLFFTDKGMYGYSAKIIKYLKEDGFNLMKVTLTSKGEKVQRRDFYRYDCYLPLKYSVVTDSSPKQEDGDKPRIVLYDGVIKDVSGGGIKFEANEVIGEGKTIKCGFKLDGRLISTIGKVLGVDNLDNGKYKYMYRIQFVKIALDDQESIVKFIFMEQRKKLGRI